VEGADEIGEIAESDVIGDAPGKFGLGQGPAPGQTIDSFG
jgi:hypothetical protein